MHNTKMQKPTATTYKELQTAYDTFNQELFSNELPDCMITLQREKKTMGYFSKGRFFNESGESTDEIAMNPAYFAICPLVEIMQTLVHEMVHLWQSHFGDPGRGRYHNKEWANKMRLVGLMPSDTGMPGGKTTGDNMSDYPILDGRFLSAFNVLVTDDFKISWFDRFTPYYPHDEAKVQFFQQLGLTATSSLSVATANNTASQIIVTTSTPVNKTNRIKYQCSCGNNVWGKPNLKITCNACDQPFAEEE